MIRRTRDTGIGPAAPATPAAPAAGRPSRQAPRTTAPAAKPAEAAPGKRSVRRPAAAASSATAPAGRKPAAAAPPPGTAVPPVSTDVPGDTLVLMRELTTLLAWENAELRARRYDAVGQTVERKQALSRAYQEKFIAFYRNPKLADDLTDDRRAAFKAQSELLSAEMATNGNLLRAGMDSVNLVMGNMVSAVQEYQAQAAPHYEGSGQLEPRHGVQARMALALNKEF